MLPVHTVILPAWLPAALILAWTTVTLTRLILGYRRATRRKDNAA